MYYDSVSNCPMVVHNKKYIRISIVLPLHKWDCKLLNKNGYKFCYAMLDIKVWLRHEDSDRHILIYILISSHVFLQDNNLLCKSDLGRSNIGITERFEVPVLNIQQIQDVHISIALIPHKLDCNLYHNSGPLR